MRYVHAKFWIKNDDNIKTGMQQWLDLVELIQPNDLYSGLTGKIEIRAYKKEDIDELLEMPFEALKGYRITIRGKESQIVEIEVSPSLNEVSHLYVCVETTKQEALCKFINRFITNNPIMMGWINPAEYNKYYERAYGHLELGAYWKMYFGQWAIKYLTEEQFKAIEEYTAVRKEQNYIEASLVKELSEAVDESFDKKKRQFMKKMKFIDSIYKIYRAKEFSNTEI